MLLAALITTVFLLGVMAVLGAYTGSLSDEEREKLGLGPKGQGRNW